MNICLGLLGRETAAFQVEELVGLNVADGCPMVAHDVVLVAEDVGDGLVAHALVDEQHVVDLVAHGTLGTANEVDGAAQRLLAGAGKHAVGVEVAG